MALNIDPKKRVAVILRSIAQNFVTAAEAIEACDEPKMRNWIGCGVKCMDALEDAIRLLHPEVNPPRSISERLEERTDN